MTRNMIEMVMGAVVLIVAGAFLWLALSITNLKSGNTITVSAVFGEIGDLNIGDDVRVAGINVGSVADTELDPTLYQAHVELALDAEVRLPDDSIARISSASLLGGSYVELIPGISDEVMTDGFVIFDTRDPVNLADLIGKAVFSGGDSQ
ncbi:MAG: outer membrane lipid asymmetry maintenance protein MlaD [Proteobacteria bacterium]|nr:outer membrane lipid asymmetry maintenance protein MlaD [Pseudomonadota bacterium]